MVKQTSDSRMAVIENKLDNIKETVQKNCDDNISEHTEIKVMLKDISEKFDNLDKKYPTKEFTYWAIGILVGFIMGIIGWIISQSFK
jgi:hypothetical protein